MTDKDQTPAPSSLQKEAENVVPEKPLAKELDEDADDVMELAKAIALAAIIALTIRTFLFEPFNIPSGSMLPNLLVGDYLFVKKYAYGYSRFSFPLNVVRFDGRILGEMPERGDIAVFRKPFDTDIDYIKRVIGLPGDTIQVREGRLYINNESVPREYTGSENYKDDRSEYVYHRYTETLPGGVVHDIYELSDNRQFDDTLPYVVPDEHFFVMGDNRDNSKDSRSSYDVGFVPVENLVGPAAFIFFSTEGIGDKCERDGFLAVVRTVGCRFVEWPGAIRYNRLFKSLN